MSYNDQVKYANCTNALFSLFSLVCEHWSKQLSHWLIIIIKQFQYNISITIKKIHYLTILGPAFTYNTITIMFKYIFQTTPISWTKSSKNVILYTVICKLQLIYTYSIILFKNYPNVQSITYKYNVLIIIFF